MRIASPLTTWVPRVGSGCQLGSKHPPLLNRLTGPQTLHFEPLCEQEGRDEGGILSCFAFGPGTISSPLRHWVFSDLQPSGYAECLAVREAAPRAVGLLIHIYF